MHSLGKRVMDCATSHLSHVNGLSPRQSRHVCGHTALKSELALPSGRAEQDCSSSVQGRAQ